jgi:hypothetical protein
MPRSSSRSATELFDGGHLFLVAADHVVDGSHRADVEVVCPAVRGDDRARRLVDVRAPRDAVDARAAQPELGEFVTRRG